MIWQRANSIKSLWTVSRGDSKMSVHPSSHRSCCSLRTKIKTSQKITNHNMAFTASKITSQERNKIYISIRWQILKWLTVWTTREQLNKICTLRWTFKRFLIQSKLLQQTEKHKSASKMTSLIDSKIQISERTF